MPIGIFAKTFAYPTLDAVAEAVASHGLHTVQFNLVCVGLPTLPEAIDPAVLTQIRTTLDARQISIAALSGTFNLIDPNLAQRREGLKRLRILAAACEPLDTSLITLCTGTRDPVDMWRWHPDNTAAEAWDDLLTALGEALDIAQTYSVILGIEPEGANVVYSARQARRLLDTLRSPHLKLVMDAANLFHNGDLTRQAAVIDEAFDLLGDEIVLAHAKDIAISAGGMEWRAAGQGLLDYDHYLRRLHDSGYSGPLILHGLTESQVADCVAFLRAKLASYP